MRTHIYFIACLSFLCSFFNTHSTPTKPYTVFIILHGTWAYESPWYLPGGCFFDEVEYNLLNKNDRVVAHTWSGRLSHSSRRRAARQLLKLIESYPPEINIVLISHSHGSNVGILASQLMGENPQNTHRITAFYAFGTPVVPRSYTPNMNVIDYFCNFFSLGDLVQPICGSCAREYPHHERIANIRFTIRGKQPHHNGMFSRTIGRWLPFVHDVFIKALHNNPSFSIDTPLLVNFTPTRAPNHRTDSARDLLIVKDYLYNQNFWTSLFHIIGKNSGIEFDGLMAKVSLYITSVRNNIPTGTQLIKETIPHYYGRLREKIIYKVSLKNR